MSKRNRVRISVELCEENNAQLERIAETYHLSKNSAIAQAVAKWYHSDPLLKKEEQSNGASHP